MSSEKKNLHLNDIGTVLRCRVVEILTDGSEAVVDISNPNTLEMCLLFSDGTKKTKTAVLTGDGTDGLFHYVTIDGDLSVLGDFSYQGQLDISGWKGHTTEVKRFIARTVCT